MISDPLPKLLQPQNMSFYPLQHLRIHDLKNIDKCQRTRTYIPIPANPQFFQDIEEYLDQICDTTPAHRTRHLLKKIAPPIAIGAIPTSLPPYSTILYPLKT